MPSPIEITAVNRAGLEPSWDYIVRNHHLVLHEIVKERNVISL